MFINQILQLQIACIYFEFKCIGYVLNAVWLCLLSATINQKKKKKQNTKKKKNKPSEFV